MTSKEKKAKIKPGVVLMIGGRIYKIKKIEDGNAIVQDMKTGDNMNYGIDALSRFNITFMDTK